MEQEQLARMFALYIVSKRPETLWALASELVERAKIIEDYILGVDLGI